MRITPEETIVLRDLSKKVREISQNPIWDEKRRLWLDKNSLKKVRPLILTSLPEAAWFELIPENTLIVKDPFFKNYERELRRKIYRWENIKDDEIINNTIYVPIEHKLTDWYEGRVRPYSDRADRSAGFSPCIMEYSDLAKLKMPELTVAWEQTAKTLTEVQEVFAKELNVVLGEPFYSGTDIEVMGWGNSLIDVLCELRGLENVLYDLYLAPNFIHEAMEFLMNGTIKYLDAMESEGLLRLNNNEYIFASNTPLGSNGLACTNELPDKGYDSEHITTKDLWGYTMAQEFTGVSPGQLNEFVLPYQKMIAERFGLNAYGCCECNDKKWEMIARQIPNLRELSVSHACNLEVAAEALKNNYVLSWKPHPAAMIATFDEQYIRDELRKGLKITQDCCVAICLRDVQTLFNEPQRVIRWTDIAMEMATANSY